MKVGSGQDSNPSLSLRPRWDPDQGILKWFEDVLHQQNQSFAGQTYQKYI
jgi:hypothetical protein